MSLLRERLELQTLLQGMPRSSRQIHGLFEADAEILRWNSDEWLVCSTDTVAEEISLGLYRDPFTWGWMTVMSSVSDLAATGVRPWGLLLATEWKFRTSSDTQKKFFAGARAALRRSQVPLLGGDSGQAPASVLNSTILGRSSRLKPLTRLGARPGDALVLISQNDAGKSLFGCGPALSLSFLFHPRSRAGFEKLFRPLPSPTRTARLRPWVRSAIDTSDGLAVSLGILAELNNVGMELEWTPDLFHPRALAFCLRHRLPPELLLMSDLGDLQTLLIVPPAHLKKVLREPRARYCGRVSKSQKIIQCNGSELPVFEATATGREASSVRQQMQAWSRRFRRFPIFDQD